MCRNKFRVFLYCLCLTLNFPGHMDGKKGEALPARTCSVGLYLGCSLSSFSSSRDWQRQIFHSADLHPTSAELLVPKDTCPARGTRLCSRDWRWECVSRPFGRGQDIWKGNFTSLHCCWNLCCPCWATESWSFPSPSNEFFPQSRLDAQAAKAMKSFISLAMALNLPEGTFQPHIPRKGDTVPNWNGVTSVQVAPGCVLPLQGWWLHHCPEQPDQGWTAIPMKNFSPVSNLNLPLCNMRPFHLVLSISIDGGCILSAGGWSCVCCCRCVDHRVGSRGEVSICSWELVISTDVIRMPHSFFTRCCFRYITEKGNLYYG